MSDAAAHPTDAAPAIDAALRNVGLRSADGAVVASQPTELSAAELSDFDAGDE